MYTYRLYILLYLGDMFNFLSTRLLQLPGIKKREVHVVLVLILRNAE